ncbi:hypothetical protein BKA83DRAFT_269162 [Pisolithus microcarpus]|nr:hypothetical protein BKA83DRAFT_269162 [Pisolithus microcarpus]
MFIHVFFQYKIFCLRSGTQMSYCRDVNVAPSSAPVCRACCFTVLSLVHFPTMARMLSYVKLHCNSILTRGQLRRIRRIGGSDQVFVRGESRTVFDAPGRVMKTAAGLSRKVPYVVECECIRVFVGDTTHSENGTRMESGTC